MKPIRPIRHLFRSLRARFTPCAFAEWLESSERCPVTVTNPQDCVWSVTLGVMPTVEAPSIGRAMLAAYRACEADPEWVWMRDFLRAWKP